MKSSLSIVFLLLFSSGSAQVFQKTYDGYYDLSRYRSSQQTADGGYILAGEAMQDVTFHHVAWLTKTDASGEIQWTKIYSEPNHAYLVSQTPDGGYIFYGRKTSNEIMLVKTDSNGVVQQANSYGSTAYIAITSLDLTSDGGVILCGNIINATTDILVIKIDSLGNVQWCKSYGGSDDDFGESVIQIYNGTFTIMATTLSFSSKHAILLVKIETDGSIMFKKIFYDDDVLSPKTIYGNSLIETADSNLVILGRISSTIHKDILLLKTDRHGSEIWSNLYDLRRGDGDIVVQTHDQGYVIGAHTKDTVLNNSDDFVLLKTDQMGNTQWTRSYGSELRETCYDAIATTDGGYAIAGSACSFNSAGIERAYFVKADAAGFSGCYDSTITSTVTNFTIPTSDPNVIVTNLTLTKTAMNPTITDADTSTNRLCTSTGIGEINLPQYLADIYPNPSSGFITVKTNSDNCDYKIFDINGKLIQHGDRKSYSFGIDLLPFVSGIYFLKLEFENGHIYKKIIHN